MIEEFKKFVMRGNLVDLAIGFTVGAAFTALAKSLVTDIIMPPVGLLMGGADFRDLFVVLREGAAPVSGDAYATLAEAQAAGAVTWNFGVFINNLIALLVVAIAMFLVIRTMNRIRDEMTEEPQEDTEPAKTPPADKKCRYCKSVIDVEASRCPFCTSTLTADANS